MHDNKPHLLYGDDQLRAIMVELHSDHIKENPFALHEVLDRSQEYQLPLPDWAVDALKSLIADYLTGKPPGKIGKDNSRIGRFRKKVIVEVRWQTYQSIMAWMRDPRLYKAMPRSIIQRWFKAEIQHKPNSAERAVDLSVEALAPTFASCTASTLLEARYYDPQAKYPDEVRDYVWRKMIVRDLGVEETSWVGQYIDYFGPCTPPPPHVEEILKLWDEPQEL